MKLAADGAEEDYDGQEHNPFVVRHARVWSRASTVLLVPGGGVAVQYFNSNNSSISRKIFQADMQLSSGCDDCWLKNIKIIWLFSKPSRPPLMTFFLV